MTLSARFMVVFVLAQERLCEFAQKLQPRKYARGEVLIEQGSSPDNLFFIQRGHCRVVRCGIQIVSS